MDASDYNRVMLALAAAAFLAIFFFDVPFPVIVLWPDRLSSPGGPGYRPSRSAEAMEPPRALWWMTVTTYWARS